MRIFTCNTSSRFALVAILLIASTSLNAQSTGETQAISAKPMSIGAVADDLTSSVIKVKTFPNPYIDRITFNITSPVSGKGMLEIYDLTGRRLEVINAGEFQAGVSKNVEYRPNLAPRTPIMYKFGVGLKTATSILIKYN